MYFVLDVRQRKQKQIVANALQIAFRWAGDLELKIK